jgi:hypothetical protein
VSRLAKAAALLALASTCTAPATAAGAEPLRPANLRVEGGEDRWHASNLFRLDWEQLPGPPVQAHAVAYRLFDSSGGLLAGPVRNTTVVGAINPLVVPERPGAYGVEVWLEDAEGQPGPPAYATLRFDDAAPSAPTPLGPSGWLNTRQEGVLRIGHPAGTPPLSGIRGYAISLDRGSGGFPCGDPNRCSVAETDLPDGVGDDSLAVGPLPEGITYARVVAVSGSGVASPVASVPLHVDGTVPQLVLEGLPSGWSPGPVRLSVRASDPLSGMAATGAGAPFTAAAVDGGAPALSLGDSVSTRVGGSGVHRISYFARDAAGNVNDGVLGSSPVSAAVSIDEEPPRVAFVPAQDPREPERIEATVDDGLSGPAPGRGTIRLRRAGSRAAFEALPTQVLEGRLVAHWESDAYPPGKYEFLATGYDRAGNAGSGGDRLRGAKMVLVNPLKAQVSMEAGFGGRLSGGSTEKRLPFGRAVGFGGRLRRLAGAALGGQEVLVTETFAAGSEPRRRTTAVPTAADGTFSLRLAPGPSRDVSASFAGTPTLTRAGAPSVHLGVLAAIRLRVSAATAKVGGAPIVFSGSVGRTGVAGAGPGLPVELEFRYPGADWAGFRTVEADGRNRFRYSYRFSDDDSRGVRFQFRASAVGQENWPYEPAASRPVSVIGR